MITTASPYRVGAQVEYSCQPGYELIGDKVAVCGESGKWTSDVPICKGIIIII